MAVLGAAGLAVRIVYTLAVGADVPTIGDAQTYHLLGENLADGLGYIRPHEHALTGEGVPTAEFPPLFPGVLAAASVVGLDTVLAQKLTLTLFGTGTVVLVGLLGRRFAGPAVGLTAAGLAAAYPMLFGIDGALMPETLYALLVTAVLVLAWRARGMDTLGRWLVLGATVGAAALTRAEALLLVPLLLVPLALRVGGNRWASLAVGLAGVVVVVGPWTLRNALVLDHFVPVSNNLGGLVVGANCPPVYEGDHKGQWLFECYGRVDPTGLDETERARAYLDAGVGYGRDNADRLPGVLTVRLLRTFGLYDPDGQIAWETLEGRDRTWQTVGHRMYLGLLAPAAVGVVGARRRRVWRWPLWSVVAMSALTAVGAYGNQRFRVAAEPALLVFAAAGLVWSIDSMARRLRRRRRPGSVGSYVPDLHDPTRFGVVALVGVALVAAGCAGSGTPAAGDTTVPPRHITVLLVGDSVMFDAAPAVDAALRATGDATVIAAPAPGQGLSDDTYRWPVEWPRLVAEHDPDAVVVLLGAWDTAAPVVDGRALAVGSHEWERWYGARLDQAARMLAGGGARVYWIAPPRFGLPHTEHRVAALHRQMRALARRDAAVELLDGAAAVSPDGATLVLPGSDGRPEQVRKTDGVHLCPAGAARIARLVVDAVVGGERIGPARPGWEDGVWRADARYTAPDHGPPCG